MLQSMGSQRVVHDIVTERQQPPSLWPLVWRPQASNRADFSCALVKNCQGSGLTTVHALPAGNPSPPEHLLSTQLLVEGVRRWSPGARGFCAPWLPERL